MDVLPVLARRIALRRLCERDLAAFQAYRNAEVGRYQGWLPMADDEAVRFLGEMHAAPPLVPGAWFQLGIADRASDALIGDIGLHLAADGREAEIGFTLNPAAQGRGLAAEAVRCALAWLFERTAIERVIAITDERNGPARRLLAAVGMRHVATAPALFRGEACAECHHALDRAAVPGGRADVRGKPGMHEAVAPAGAAES